MNTAQNEAVTKKATRRMLTAEQVMDIVPISRTTLFRLERDGLFPQGKALTPHRKLWFEDEIVAWQKDLQDPDFGTVECDERATDAEAAWAREGIEGQFHGPDVG